MQGALGGVVLRDGARERLERRAAERVIRTAARGGAESRHDTPINAKGRKAVADALLGVGEDRSDRLAKLLERGPLLRRDTGEVLVNSGRFAAAHRSVGVDWL